MDKLLTFWAAKSNIQVSGELTTSRGPGTTLDFFLSLVKQLYDGPVSKTIIYSLLLDASDGCLRKELNKVDWSIDHDPRVLIPVANGSEVTQVVIVADILRRAKFNVIVASVEKSLQILASQRIKLVADDLIGKAAELAYDFIILQGDGDALQGLNKSKVLKGLLNEQESSGRFYGAIFSSPVSVQSQGLDQRKKAKSNSFLVDKIKNKLLGVPGVVIDGNVITSSGLATVMDFALTIVTKLCGTAWARSVAEGLVYEYPRHRADSD